MNSPALVALERRYVKIVNDVERLRPEVTNAAAFIHKVEELAKLVRSIRYRLTEQEGWLADKMADLLDDLDGLVCATAGELVAAGVEVDKALDIVDERRAYLYSLAGKRTE